jgi:hypothetical protein
MTLITAGNSDGVYGRCDAKCHDATEPQCHCICGGRFHGKRSSSPELRQAIEEHGRELIRELGKQGHDVSGLQEELFGGPLFAGRIPAKGERPC